MLGSSGVSCYSAFNNYLSALCHLRGCKLQLYIWKTIIYNGFQCNMNISGDTDGRGISSRVLIQRSILSLALEKRLQFCRPMLKFHLSWLGIRTPNFQ